MIEIGNLEPCGGQRVYIPREGLAGQQEGHYILLSFFWTLWTPHFPRVKEASSHPCLLIWDRVQGPSQSGGMEDEGLQ